MTDRIHALTVVLESDIREDDVQELTRVIELLRGVSSVHSHIANPDIFAARERVRRDLIAQLQAVLKD
jgi:hypothetical protein